MVSQPLIYHHDYSGYEQKGIFGYDLAAATVKHGNYRLCQMLIERGEATVVAEGVILDLDDPHTEWVVERGQR